MALFGTPEAIEKEVKTILSAFGPGTTGHVFNLGHGIDKHTPIEQVERMI
jgi:uroporphyrinogen decarboxylase